MSGSVSRTAVNERNGGKTQLVSVMASVTMLVVLLVPPVREAFGGAAMDAWQWATVLGLAFLSLVQTEAAKAIGRWRARRGQATAGLRG